MPRGEKSICGYAWCARAPEKRKQTKCVFAFAGLKMLFYRAPPASAPPSPPASDAASLQQQNKAWALKSLATGVSVLGLAYCLVQVPFFSFSPQHIRPRQQIVCWCRRCRWRGCSTWRRSPRCRCWPSCSSTCCGAPPAKSAHPHT